MFVIRGCFKVGNPSACHKGQLGPSGPKSKKKTENESPARPPKVQNGVENESKSIIFQRFWLVFDSVLDFLDTCGGEALQGVLCCTHPLQALFRSPRKKKPGRIKRAPSHPFSLRGIGPFPAPENPPFCWKPNYFHKISCMNPLWGKR